LLILIGLFVQIAAKICLGRSFGLIAANRGVKSQGPYRFVRHPMYAGYTLTHIGLFLSMPSLKNALLYSLALSFQLVRIVREEAVLRQDAEYRAFAEQVRFRLVPKLF
jgi:protein-S-isoprenylcysteine O-methyltransferase Ste14